MDSILENVINFVVELVKLVVYVIVWEYILFYLGVIVLKIVTILKYPSGNQLDKQVNIISGVGINTLFIAWSSIATYNNDENIYFLMVGIFIAIIQSLLIGFKYYHQDKVLMGNKLD